MKRRRSGRWNLSEITVRKELCSILSIQRDRKLRIQAIHGYARHRLKYPTSKRDYIWQKSWYSTTLFKDIKSWSHQWFTCKIQLSTLAFLTRYRTKPYFEIIPTAILVKPHSATYFSVFANRKNATIGFWTSRATRDPTWRPGNTITVWRSK